MTVLPFQFNEVVRLYNRVSKLSPTILLEKEHGETRDIVGISTEGKKKQILAQTKDEVLERIKEAR